MSKKLAVLDLPGHACDGHACDRCSFCEQGICCGEAVVDANLPAQGSWEGKLYAPLGELRLDGDGKLICHICGVGYDALYAHVRTHKLTPDEYRAMFGLRCQEPLASPRMQEERARNARPDTAAAARLKAYQDTFTPEQRSAWSRNREERIQSQRSSNSRRDSSQQQARSLTFHDRRKQDPDVDRRWRGALIVAKRPKLDEGVTCKVCGAVFCVVNSRAIKQRSPRKTCGSPDCTKEIRRQAQAASAASRRKKSDEEDSRRG